MLDSNSLRKRGNKLRSSRLDNILSSYQNLSTSVMTTTTSKHEPLLVLHKNSYDNNNLQESGKFESLAEAFINPKNSTTTPIFSSSTAKPSSNNITRKESFLPILVSSPNQQTNKSDDDDHHHDWHSTKLKDTNNDNNNDFEKEEDSEIVVVQCQACKTKITSTGIYISSTHQIFHSECFSCSQCEVNLKHKTFFIRNELLYCKECHIKSFVPRCFSCKEFILSIKAVVVNGKPYHSKCLLCSCCGCRIKSYSKLLLLNASTSDMSVDRSRRFDRLCEDCGRMFE